MRWLAFGSLLVGLSVQAQTLTGPGYIYSAWRAAQAPRAELAAASAPRELAAVDPAPAADSALMQRARRLLDAPGTVALLLLDHGRIVFEGYSKGAGAEDRLFSFSMAKTMTALAVGRAHCDGRIRSLDDRADAYTDELAGTAYGDASVKDLLRMSSGARAGTGATHGQPRTGLTPEMLSGKVTVLSTIREYGARERVMFGEVKPGSRFAYNNVDTDALSRVVQGATAQPFTAWFGTTVLADARPERTSFWRLDSQGQAIAHVAYMATLRDWGRIALAILDTAKGRAGSPCMQAFVRDATTRQIATLARDSFRGYGYQVWVDDPFLPKDSAWLLGFGGQRIGIDPASERILVTFAWQPQAEVFGLFNEFVR